MATDPYVPFLKQVRSIQDAKAGLVWNFLMVEQHMADYAGQKAHDAMLKLASELQEVVRVVCISPKIRRIPEASIELKQICEFATEIETILRGRSWPSMCRDFDPKAILDNINLLNNILARPSNPARTPKKKSTSREDDMSYASHAPNSDRSEHMASLRDTIQTRKDENSYLARGIPRAGEDIHKWRLAHPKKHSNTKLKPAR